jgi:hypothetical protein
MLHRTQLRRNRSNAPLDVSNSKPLKSRGLRDLVIATAAVLSLLATLLTLAGFGVSLAIEQFGIAHETLFGSTLDLLDLSCWVVLFFFENINEISFWQEYLRLLPDLFPGVAIGYLIIVVGIGLYHQRTRMIIRNVLGSQWIRTLKPHPRDSLKAWIAKASLYCLAFWVVLPAVYIGIVCLLVVVSALLLMAPYMGFAAGNLHVARHVVEPQHCEPLRTRASKLKAVPRNSKKPIYNANCVAVRTERGLYEQGRVVIATTNAILLYHPSTGRAVRIPTKDAIIEAIGVLQDPEEANEKRQQTKG